MAKRARKSIRVGRPAPVQAIRPVVQVASTEKGLFLLDEMGWVWRYRGDAAGQFSDNWQRLPVSGGINELGRRCDLPKFRRLIPYKNHLFALDVAGRLWGLHREMMKLRRETVEASVLWHRVATVGSIMPG